jgi:ribonuclease E
MSLNVDALTAEDLAVSNDKLDDPIDTSALDDLAAQLKASTDALAGAVADSADLKDTQTVVLHADDPTQPTVEVTMPAVLPEVISVTDVSTVPNVDPTSPEPQVSVTVEAGTEEAVVSEDTVTDVITTDEGLTDVVVTAPTEVHEATVADSGVDVIEAVKEAYDVSGPEIEAAPEVVPAPVEEAPVEVVAEPVVEAPVEPVAEVAVEAPVEPVAEVAVEAPVDAPVEAPAEPVVEEAPVETPPTE